MVAKNIHEDLDIVGNKLLREYYAINFGLSFLLFYSWVVGTFKIKIYLIAWYLF